MHSGQVSTASCWPSWRILGESYPSADILRRWKRRLLLAAGIARSELESHQTGLSNRLDRARPNP